jgi:preprotein translocase subunit SecE
MGGAGSFKDRAAVPCPEAGDHFLRQGRQMARTSPVEFFRQVKAETAKVVWPSRRETIMTGVMVMIMTTLLGIFFVAIDSIFDLIVNFLLSLAK